MQSAVISARATIAKAEALIVINERKFASVKKKWEELEAAKTQVEEILSAHSSKLESLQAQLTAKGFLSEEELRPRLSWRLRKRVSTRCIASENKSVLWQTRIISLLLLFLL